MLNIGFFELLLISVVALLVLGPEKLPGAIRTTALWVGRARRSFNKVKTEIEQQINADDIRRQLHNESILADLKETRDKTRSLIDSSSKEAREISDDLSKSMTELASRKNIPLLDEEQDEKPGGEPDGQPDDTPTTDNTDEQASADKNQDQLPETAAEPPAKPPVQDFYNNQETGLVELQGSKPLQAAKKSDEGHVPSGSGQDKQ